MRITLLCTGLLSLLIVSAAPAATPASDAQYTLLCQTFTGPGNAQAAKQAKDTLLKVTKLHDWYVVTGDNDSSLYYGFYRTFNDPKDSDTVRAQEDRKAVAELTDTAGNRPFRFAVFVPVAGNDPTAPPEWDLRNAKGYFSLEIGVYMDSPMRKQAAVDAVREARKEGIEAYYYHGEHVSHVCIGAWPRSAVREQEASVAQTTDPNQPILVSTTPLPPSFTHDLRTRDTNQKVKVMEPKLEPIDPSLIAAMKRYPLHCINGEAVVRKYSKDGQSAEVQDPSFLIYIPQKEEVVKQDPALQQKAVEMGVVPEANAPKKGEGRLKSIGD